MHSLIHKLMNNIKNIQSTWVRRPIIIIASIICGIVGGVIIVIAAIGTSAMAFKTETMMESEDFKEYCQRTFFDYWTL